MMMSASILFSTFAPFPTLSLSVPQESTLEDVYSHLYERYPTLPAELTLSTHSGIVLPSTTVSSLCNGESLLTLRLSPSLLGGKGGFGSQLRAAGGRMSSQKTSNNDSCRDLSGRRLSTIKEAKKLAEYLETEPARKKAVAEAQKTKLENLEKKLGITPASAGSSSKPQEPEPLAGKKHRFDDTEYLEQSREIVDSVKSAVAAGFMKNKKRKVKVDPPPVEASKGLAAVSEAIVTSPDILPVAVAASVVAAVGA